MAHAHCMLDNYGYRCCVISIALPVQQRLHARVSLVTSHGRCMSCYTSAAKSYNKRVYDLRHVTSKERHKRCCRKFKWASSTAKCHHIPTGLKSGKNGHLTCTVLHGHLQASRLYCKVSSHNWVKIWQKRASDVHSFTWSPESISTVIRIPFRARAAPGKGGKEANISCPMHVYREP